MAETVRIFISCASADLRSLREQLKLWLLDMGWHPVVMEHFPPDYRNVVEMLRNRISECDAVIHIVGGCYGSEPESRPAGAPRKSFTQLEAEMARKLRKPLFVVLPDETFPVDEHPPEKEELRSLQESYRDSFRSADPRPIQFGHGAELEREIRKLRVEIDKLRRSRARTRIAAVAVLVAMAAFGIYSWRAREATKTDIGDIRQVLMRVVQDTQSGGASNTAGSADPIRAAVYRIAAESGVDPDALSKRVNSFIADTASSHAASLRDKALAAFAKKDNAGAMQLADAAVDSIAHGPGTEDFKRPLVRDMYTLAGKAAAELNKWSDAETRFRKALAATRPDTETDLYLTTALSLANSLNEEDRDDDETKLLADSVHAVAGHVEALGEDGPARLNDVADAQYEATGFSDAAATLRESLRLGSLLRLGHPDSDAAYAYTLLSMALDRDGKNTESEDAAKKAKGIVESARAGDPMWARVCEAQVNLATMEDDIAESRVEIINMRGFNSLTEAETSSLEAMTDALHSSISYIQGETWALGSAIAFEAIFILGFLRAIKRLTASDILRYTSYWRACVGILRRGRFLRWSLTIAALLFVAGLLPVTMIHSFTGVPGARSRVIAAARDRVQFARVAFDEKDKYLLESEEDLAQQLAGENDTLTTSGDRREAEALLKHVIGMREADSDYSGYLTSESMKKLSAVLKADGKTVEAKQWEDRAATLQRAEATPHK